MDYESYYNKVTAIAEKYADLLDTKIEEAKKGDATSEQIRLILDGIRALHDTTVIVCRVDALRKGVGTVYTHG